MVTLSPAPGDDGAHCGSTTASLHRRALTSLGEAPASPPCPALQGFVRSTTKYWVRSEDVSNVKYHILQHLPVFQFDTNNFAGGWCDWRNGGPRRGQRQGGAKQCIDPVPTQPAAPPAGDAQLINSVYFDNENLELYHGRLDKKPGAIALRIRWCGSPSCGCNARCPSAERRHGVQANGGAHAGSAVPAKLLHAACGCALGSACLGTPALTSAHPSAWLLPPKAQPCACTQGWLLSRECARLPWQVRPRR
jgi:hypothetical protein